MTVGGGGGGMWQYHNSKDPCPLCGGKSDCRTSSRGTVHCRRTDDLSPPYGWNCYGEDSQGFRIFAAVDSDWTPSGSHTSSSATATTFKPSKFTSTESERAEIFRHIGTNSIPVQSDFMALSILENKLGVPSDVIVRLGVKAWAGHGHLGFRFIFPEKNSEGVEVGYHLRAASDHDENGNKIRKLAYGQRGLTVPHGWLPERGGSLYIVEGASDVLAQMAMGLHSIGRPSNTGGADMLAKMLADAGMVGPEDNRTIIVMGESDARVDEHGVKRWPGRDGADRIAGVLSRELRREIVIAYPPEGFKDVREFFVEHTQGDTGGVFDRDYLLELGERFCESLTGVEIVGKNPTPIKVDEDIEEDEADVAGSAPFESRAYLANPNLPGERSLAEVVPTILNGCPAPTSQILLSSLTGEARIIHPCCKRISCQFCGQKRRDLWEKTLRRHITEWGENVFMFRVSAADWNTVRKYMKYHMQDEANFVRIDVGGGGNLLVVANCQPGPKVESSLVMELSPETAIAKIVPVVQSITEASGPRPFMTSRGWGVEAFAAPKNTGEWKHDSQIAATPKTCNEIITGRGARPKIRVSKPSEYWPYFSQTFSVFDLNVPYEHLRLELQVGDFLPNVDVEWGGGSGDDGGGGNDGWKSATEEFSLW